MLKLSLSTENLRDVNFTGTRQPVIVWDVLTFRCVCCVETDSSATTHSFEQLRSGLAEHIPCEWALLILFRWYVKISGIQAAVGSPRESIEVAVRPLADLLRA